MINPNNIEEQLYYPPPNYIVQSENIVPQEDSHFRDLTISHSDEDANQNIDKNCVFHLINWLDSMNKIKRIDSSSFTLNNVYITPILIIFIIVLAIIIGFFTLKNEPIFVILIIGGMILLWCIIILLLAGCKEFYKTILKLEQKSIVLSKKAMFKTKNIMVYNFGELEKAEIYYKHLLEHQHIFTFYFKKKTGDKEEFHKIVCSKENEDLKGVKYFIDLINLHIQNNMN